MEVHQHLTLGTELQQEFHAVHRLAGIVLPEVNLHALHAPGLPFVQRLGHLAEGELVAVGELGRLPQQHVDALLAGIGHDFRNVFFPPSAVHQHVGPAHLHGQVDVLAVAVHTGGTVGAAFHAAPVPRDHTRTNPVGILQYIGRVEVLGHDGGEHLGQRAHDGHAPGGLQGEVHRELAGLVLLHVERVAGIGEGKFALGGFGAEQRGGIGAHVGGLAEEQELRTGTDQRGRIEARVVAVALHVAPGMAAVVALVGDIGLVIVIRMVEAAAQTVFEVAHADAAGLVGYLYAVDVSLLGQHVAEGKAVVIEAEEEREVPVGRRVSGRQCELRKVVAALQLLAGLEGIGLVQAGHVVRHVFQLAAGEVALVGGEAEGGFRHQLLAVLLHGVGQATVLQMYRGGQATVGRSHVVVIGIGRQRGGNEAARHP